MIHFINPIPLFQYVGKDLLQDLKIGVYEETKKMKVNI